MSFLRKLLGLPEKETRGEKIPCRCISMDTMEKTLLEIIELYPAYCDANVSHRLSLIDSPKVFETKEDYVKYCMDKQKSKPLYKSYKSLEGRIKLQFDILMGVIPDYGVSYKICGLYVCKTEHEFSTYLHLNKTVDCNIGTCVYLRHGDIGSRASMITIHADKLLKVI